MHWDIIKWILIGLLAVPILLIPAGIYAGVWLSKELLEVGYWINKIKTQGIKGSFVTKFVCISMVFILTLAWGIKGHSEKTMYAQYISHQVSNEYGNFANNILRNNTIYAKILSTNRVENWHLGYLAESNSSIAFHFQKYRNLAIQFDKIKDYQLGNSVIPEIMEISSYFRRLNGEMEQEHGADANLMFFELEDSHLEKIELIHQLNSAWVEKILEHVEGTSRTVDNRMGSYIDLDTYHRKYWNKAVTDDFWIDVLIDINDETEKFLWRNDLLWTRWLQR